MPITDFLELLQQTVTLAAFSSQNIYGTATYASGVTYKARIVKRPHRVRNNSGETVVAKGEVWFGPPTADLTDSTPPTITTQDRITLPDASTPIILSVDVVSDDSGGYHHTKVHFG